MRTKREEIRSRRRESLKRDTLDFSGQVVNYTDSADIVGSIEQKDNSNRTPENVQNNIGPNPLIFKQVDDIVNEGSNSPERRKSTRKTFTTVDGNVSPLSEGRNVNNSNSSALKMLFRNEKGSLPRVESAWNINENTL